MSQSRRYYAVMIGDKKGYSKVGEWLAPAVLDTHATYKSLTLVSQSQNAIKVIQNDLPTLPEILIFETKEDAEDYAEDTALRVQPTGADMAQMGNKSHAKIYQTPILKISVPATAKLEEVKQKVPLLSKHKIPSDTSEYQTIPNDPKKTYTYYKLKNEPANFIIHETWINKKPISSLQTYPTSYNGFFGSTLLLPNARQSIANAIQLLEDYHTPKKWYAIHHWNRHHKADAITFIMDLKHKTESKSAFDYLMQKRQELIERYKNVKSSFFVYGYEDLMKGSFMRRLDFALSELAKNLPVEPKSSPTPARTRDKK